MNHEDELRGFLDGSTRTPGQWVAICLLLALNGLMVWGAAVGTLAR